MLSETNEIPTTSPEPSTTNPIQHERWEHPVSVGRHSARILSAEVRPHQNGYDLVCIRLQILDAQIEGHVESKWYHLKSKKVIQFLKREFAKIGFDVSNPAELSEACDQMKGLEIETNVDYACGSPVIYFLKRSEPIAATQSDPTALWQS